MVVNRLSLEIYASQITIISQEELNLWTSPIVKMSHLWEPFQFCLLQSPVAPLYFSKCAICKNHHLMAWTTESRHRKWQRPKLGIERFWNLQWFFTIFWKWTSCKICFSNIPMNLYKRSMRSSNQMDLLENLSFTAKKWQIPKYLHWRKTLKLQVEERTFEYIKKDGRKKCSYFPKIDHKFVLFMTP